MSIKRSRIITSLTIFLSAFLLFTIEPMIGKRLLPLFGGGAFVWTTLMLFFTATLFLGYLYAAVLTRLSLTWQKRIHTSLILFSLLTLVHPQSAQSGGSPIASVLTVAIYFIGLPFFLLSSTSTLLQYWSAVVDKRNNPYSLYAISSLGALAGLLSYPIIIEPFVSLSRQETIWKGSYVLVAVMLSVITWKTKNFAQRSLQTIVTQVKPARITLWVLLSSLSSFMLLSTTSYLTQEIPPVPFLWLLPLALYLLSFILAFSNNWWNAPRFLGIILVFLVFSSAAIYQQRIIVPFAPTVSIFLLTLFVLCFLTHTLLYQNRPTPHLLSIFYLAIAAGSVIASILSAVIAPTFFSDFWEIDISLYAALLLALLVLTRSRKMLCLVLILILMAMHYFTDKQVSNRKRITSKRNAYGIMRIYNIIQNGQPVGREMRLGNTVQGSQYINLYTRMEQYNSNDGVWLAMKNHPKRKRGESLRIGAIGLGAGEIAGYCKSADTIRYYEINPEVIRASQSYFTYLSDCKDRGGNVSIIEGDGRLSLEKEFKQTGSQLFDVLVVDVFQGFTIPTHVLTREAFILYQRHLAPQGVIIVHITNVHLNLLPVVVRTSDGLGFSHYSYVVPSPHNLSFYGKWVILSTYPSDFGTPITPQTTKYIRPWTDDYSNVFGALR